jgi:hypothetical protein
MLERELERAHARISELEGREWHRYEAGDRPVVAMPPPGPDPDEGYEYRYDDTGLIRDRVPIDPVD